MCLWRRHLVEVSISAICLQVACSLTFVVCPCSCVQTAQLACKDIRFCKSEGADRFLRFRCLSMLSRPYAKASFELRLSSYADGLRVAVSLCAWMVELR